MRICNLHIQSIHSYKNQVVCVQYADTNVMMKVMSRALYAYVSIHVKTEVYFCLKEQNIQGLQSGLGQ